MAALLALQLPRATAGPRGARCRAARRAPAVVRAAKQSSERGADESWFAWTKRSGRVPGTTRVQDALEERRLANQRARARYAQRTHHLASNARRPAQRDAASCPGCRATPLPSTRLSSAAVSRAPRARRRTTAGTAKTFTPRSAAETGRDRSTRARARDTPAPPPPPPPDRRSCLQRARRCQRRASTRRPAPTLAGSPFNILTLLAFLFVAVPVRCAPSSRLLLLPLAAGPAQPASARGSACARRWWGSSGRGGRTACTGAKRRSCGASAGDRHTTEHARSVCRLSRRARARPDRPRRKPQEPSPR